MIVTAQTFMVPKSGNSAAECEDSAAPVDRPGLQSRVFRAAVADGATEAAFSRVWAELIVEHLCQRDWQPSALRRHLGQLRAKWQLAANAAPLPWFAEQKVARGSFAAFAAIRIKDGEGARAATGSWKAIWIGDCCVFQIRKRQLLASFPFVDAKEFDNSPFLLSTNSNKWTEELGRIQWKSGEWNIDDCFLLATDAMAQCLLKLHADGRDPWSVVLDLDTRDAATTFDTWVAQLRMSADLRNDDTTLLRVDIS